MVAVRENQNGGWRLDVRRRRRESVTIDGWQQGWRLSGDGREPRAVLRAGPDLPRSRWGPAGAAGRARRLALLSCAAGEPAARRGRAAPPPVVVAVVGLLGVGMIGGWWGSPSERRWRSRSWAVGGGPARRRGLGRAGGWS